MDLVAITTPMVAVVVDMVTGLTMVLTTVEYHIWVDHNQEETSKIIMHTDINPTVRGVVVAMEHNLVTEVLEDVKVL